jgi:lysophospholipase L1-like esterase
MRGTRPTEGVWLARASGVYRKETAVPKRPAILALAAAVAAAVTFFAFSPGVSQAAEPVRIMPLGDSITGNPGCWRAYLWRSLQQNGFTNIDFVGTQPAQGCGFTHDGDNEGHGGFLATNIANQGQVRTWAQATRPDIILMHLGTNDVWSNIAPATITAAFSKIVDDARSVNPNVRFVVAQIIPMGTGSTGQNPCPECAQRVINLNNAIPGWAASKTTGASPVTVVDVWSGFNTTIHTGDGVHPNDSGFQLMAQKWYPATVAALNGVTPTTVSTTPPTTRATTPPTTRATTPPTTRATTPPTTRATTPPTTSTGGPGGCSATYRIAGQWPGGFQGEVTVTNGSTAISAWSVRWTYANGQTISQSWSSTLVTGAPNVQFRNAAWNGSLGAGASTTFGFIGSWNGTNTAPTVTCTVG